MKSAIYQGTIYHTRFVPIKHNFNYKIFMTYLDLDEIGIIFNKIPFWSDNGKKNLAYFNRNDYLKPNNISLKDLIRSIILNRAEYQHTGPIRMLTHLRILGYCFNPVTFYYCFDKKDTQLEFVIAEITNTPWNERHQYLLDLRHNDSISFPKVFHISPFMDMDMQYHWKFKLPGDDLAIMMDVHKDKRYFIAKLGLKKQHITKRNMFKILIKSSLINYKVIWGIYWQAAKLYIKKAPFYSYPKYK